MADTTKGSQLVTADIALGVSGKPKTVYGMHILSGGTAGVVLLRNGAAVGDGIYIHEKAAVVSVGNNVNYGDGFYFPNGCFVDVDTNVVSVLISYKEL